MHKTSPNGIHKLTNEEGRRLKKYRDSKGLWTIGVGHLILPHENFGDAGITERQCDELLASDLAPREFFLNKCLKVAVNQNQFDALMSLLFNIGNAAFARSTVLRKLNAGDTQGAAQAFLMWRIGSEPHELTPRRQREIVLFNTPEK